VAVVTEPAVAAVAVAVAAATVAAVAAATVAAVAAATVATVAVAAGGAGDRRRGGGISDLLVALEVLFGAVRG
jgi:Spy/CpxP family protein refolding chaperone